MTPMVSPLVPSTCHHPVWKASSIHTGSWGTITMLPSRVAAVMRALASSEMGRSANHGRLALVMIVPAIP